MKGIEGEIRNKIDDNRLIKRFLDWLPVKSKNQTEDENDGIKICSSKIQRMSQLLSFQRSLSSIEPLRMTTIYK